MHTTGPIRAVNDRHEGCSMCLSELSKQALSGAQELCHNCRLPFEERAQLAQNACGKRLFELMALKRSNLAVAADVGTVQEVLRIAEAAGPHIAVLKTHVDIFDEWNSGIAAQLRKLAEEHGRAAICWWHPFISCLLMPGMESGGMHGRQGLEGQPVCRPASQRVFL